ncbi:MAG: YceI family protein [Pseudomonadota bacterium]
MKLLTSFVALAAAGIAASLTNAEPKEWTLDLGHAYVGWEIDHMGLSKTVGQFRDFDGTFLIDEESPENSHISFTVQVASIDSHHPGRVALLRHADYFDAAIFPEITFVSEEVQMLTPQAGKVHGVLTMRGVDAPLTLDFEMVRDRQYPSFIPNYDEVRVVGFEAEAEILRLDHGMDFIAFLDSPTELSVRADLHFDLVDCNDVPETNVPCHWGREGFEQ